MLVGKPWFLVGSQIRRWECQREEKFKEGDVHRAGSKMEREVTNDRTLPDLKITCHRRDIRGGGKCDDLHEFPISLETSVEPSW